MDIRFWLIQAFNGISYGALLFLVGSGLSLIFGVMRIVNLSHGSYFLLGGYRIFMIATATVIGVGLWLAMEKTRIGAAVRATVDDAQMARGVGIDTSRISMLIFTLGALLAALGGVIGGAFLGIYPGLDFEMLPLAFAVVIIGGMGSLGGAAIGALLVGLADNFGKALYPEVSYFTLYAPMALILAVKPTGLFGRE